MKKQSKLARVLETLSICAGIIAGMLMIVAHGTTAIPEATLVVASAVAWAIINTIERR